MSGVNSTRVNNTQTCSVCGETERSIRVGGKVFSTFVEGVAICKRCYKELMNPLE